MNSDPFDSAAWRSFNMLDPAEAADFDEAMAHDPALRSATLEMDRLAAAIAATLAVPVEPAPAQLDNLQVRLGLKPSHRPHFWTAISGWTFAVLLAIALTLHFIDVLPPYHSTASPTTPPNGDAAAVPPAKPATPVATNPLPVAPATAETERLNDELTALRESLQSLQEHDRMLSEAIPGTALPLVMTLSPPAAEGEEPAALNPLTILLADPSASADQPVAVSLYDAARDEGTLVVHHMPAAPTGESYHLWVVTEPGAAPAYIGSIPEENAAASSSFEFSLGSAHAVPAGFLITRDTQDQPAAPTAANTILQGPPAR